jgi:adenosine deaminase
MPNILVATLGRWELVPEIIGFTNPDMVDLYQHHPQAGPIKDIRQKARIPSVEQIWLITTGGFHASGQLSRLREWRDALPPEKAPGLFVWKVAKIEDLATETECRVMSEAIFRVVLHARESAGKTG